MFCSYLPVLSCTCNLISLNQRLRLSLKMHEAPAFREREDNVDRIEDLTRLTVKSMTIMSMNHENRMAFSYSFYLFKMRLNELISCW